MLPGTPANPPSPPPERHAPPPARPRLPPTPESWLPREHNLYRPRHSRGQRGALVCAVVFFLAPALAFVLGVRPAEFENRQLAEFPGPGDGWGFFTGLPAWATDHLPLREAGVRAAEAVSTGVFGDPPGAGAGTGGRDGPVGVEPPDDDPDRAPEVPKEHFPRAVLGTDGWYYLGDDMTHKCFPVHDVDEVIRRLNRLRRAVESSGRQFELVFAPDKTTMAPEHLPEDYLGEECTEARTREFWERVPAATGAIDLRPALHHAYERLGAPVYGPLDSHWTFAGGLTMTYALAERLAPGSTESWEVERNGRRPWVADVPRLHGKHLDRGLDAFALAPDGGPDRTDYVGSNFRKPLHLEQTGPAAEGTVRRPVGVLADSFTQFATPYLAATVRDLRVVHHNTLALSSGREIAELLADRDVVVVQFVERIIAGGGSALLRDSALDTLAATLERHPR
ncbi:alginate O-acetyltransferase AlgX-related protein [Saccharomonospora halophila]|uniref:alginate O-acetyltransferase AlgX-related protein n=1 Tax=Saccharomonospora halophila TaxID=129922 RepID=UPI0018DD0B85|nr:hypothetical protein [Saccharomonospora halophila]